jgi:hypothetical protein
MSGETQDKAGWLDRFFASYYAHRPVNATFIGVHDLDHVLPDFSENGCGDAVAEMEGLLRESASPSFSETPWEALDRRLAEGFLKIQLWEYDSRHFHRGNPSLYTGEAVFGVMALFLTDFAPLADRVERAAARLAAVPRLLAQGRENVRRAPLAWTDRAIRECKGALAFLTRGMEILLADSGSVALQGRPDKDRSFAGGWIPGDGEPDSPLGTPAHGRALSSLRTAAREAACAFESFQEYLTAEVRRHPSNHYSCGEEAFSLHMREGHFLEQAPEEILTYAQGQLAEAAVRVEEHPHFTPGDLEGLAAFHPLVDRYYDAYRETWDAVRRRAEERELLTWPEFPIRYVPRPRWSREAAPYLYFLSYRSPAAFNRPPVHDYLVTPIDPTMPREKSDELLRANNDSVIKLNHVIHHGSIGHHVQNWHAFRSPSRVGQVSAVDCAARIAMFCGGTMAEGWACYATDLMAEAGALTPLEAYAEMRGRTRMCARTIVDVQLHLGRMTLEEAALFYQEHAGMGRDAAVGEAVKNSMFPGAAVIYLLGTDAIHGLRQELAATAASHGRAFVLRDFHDTLLSYGSLPVGLVAQDMKERAMRPRGTILDQGETGLGPGRTPGAQRDRETSRARRDGEAPS